MHTEVGASDPVAAVHAFEAIADRFGVEIVAWPFDERHRQVLARAGVPRLLLVAADTAPPTDLGLDEDWIHVPCSGDAVVERMEELGRSLERLGRNRPTVDPQEHVVRRGTASVVLSVSQLIVVGALLADHGSVVPRDVLEALVWPGGAPGSKALDAVVFRLRRRLAGLGLVVRTAHGQGFAIDAYEPGTDPPPTT